MSWWQEALTDTRGQFDIAVIMVPIGSLGILGISAYSVVVNHQNFDALQVGGGIAAMISALFASKWGDAKAWSVTNIAEPLPPGQPPPAQPAVVVNAGMPG